MMDAIGLAVLIFTLVMSVVFAIITVMEDRHK
jgi:hypothetical protein